MLKYLDFIDEKEKVSNLQGEIVLQSIPTNLHEEVLNDFFGKVLDE